MKIKTTKSKCLCKHCLREMDAAGYEQNPYCLHCLPERLKEAKRKSGPVRLVDDGGWYVKVIRSSASAE